MGCGCCGKEWESLTEFKDGYASYNVCRSCRVTLEDALRGNDLERKKSALTKLKGYKGNMDSTLWNAVGRSAASVQIDMDDSQGTVDYGWTDDESSDGVGRVFGWILLAGGVVAALVPVFKYWGLGRWEKLLYDSFSNFLKYNDELKPWLIIGLIVAGMGGIIVGCCRNKSTGSTQTDQYATRPTVQSGVQSGVQTMAQPGIQSGVQSMAQSGVQTMAQPGIQTMAQPAQVEEQKKAEIDPMEELMKFKKMLDAGLITDEDYQKKKEQILGL